jgi:hypothetical protein
MYKKVDPKCWYISTIRYLDPTWDVDFKVSVLVSLILTCTVTNTLGFSFFTSRTLATDVNIVVIPVSLNLQHTWSLFVQPNSFPAISSQFIFDCHSRDFLSSHSSSKVSHIATDGKSVSLGVEPHLGLLTRYLLLVSSYGLASLKRPLWREDGSVFCICCCPLLVHAFSGPSPLGLTTIFYYLRLERYLTLPPLGPHSRWPVILVM